MVGGSSRATYRLSNKATMVVPSMAAAGSLDMVRSEDYDGVVRESKPLQCIIDRRSMDNREM